MLTSIEAVCFESQDRILSGHVFHPVSSAPRSAGLLFVHGLWSSEAGYLPRADAVSTAIDVTCLTFDLGGHGASEGVLQDLSPRDHLSDVVAALDLLRTRAEIDPERIGVCAASYGAYLAGLAISNRLVKRLLLRAPAVYTDDSIEVPLGRQREERSTGSSTAVFTRLSSFPGEILVVECERDRVIPPSLIERYVSSSPRARRVVIAGAGHTLEPRFEQTFVEIISDWFRDL